MAEPNQFKGFPARLVEAREDQRLSQAALGRAVNRSGAAVSSWERGESLPEPAIWEALARQLHVSQMWLLYNSGAKIDAQGGDAMHNAKSLLIKKIWERNISPEVLSALTLMVDATTQPDAGVSTNPQKRA